ncbi:hypothetical protein DUNSADRAFT_8019 [Dunaliella salina]|uniref:Uncharacterized protein n=1 Tax=Dunaliella salina TaxID=3046 RepID=A0ABQ7GK84_DUNSA|nr:hypothetical protein DUNSADRAFT_8019 [Dunaliella salina]|eukprot:KAF5835016.1 hypothetical protein DUNSADRAFT_8019 [Dunaliella salina]
MGKEDSIKDFQNFNFDDDPRFKEYMSRFEVVNAASAEKLKAKFYKAQIDPNFDVSWAAEASKTANSSGPRSSTFFQSSTPPPRTENHSSSTSGQHGGSARFSSSSSASSNSAPPLKPRMQQQRIFLYHVAVLALVLVHLVPLAPVPWSRRAYRLLLQLSLLGQGYKLYLRHGLPTFRPWAALQTYLNRVVPTNDFYMLVIGFSFMSHAPMTLVLAPLTISAAYGVAEYLGTHYKQNRLWQKYGQPAATAMQRRSAQAELASASSEVLVGVFLVMNLFSVRRNILLTFAFWNLLKMRYHASEARFYHKQVWHKVGARTSGVRQKLPPPFQSGVNFIVKWFQTAQ